MGGNTLRDLSVGCASFIALGMCFVQSTQAASITYSVANEAGSTWVYSYTLTNSSQAGGLSEFRLLFTPGGFESLQVAASPPNWDPVVAQPDPGLSYDGYVDWLGVAGPLAFGDSLSGFQVRFTWLGSGTPGIQPFIVLDPNTFETLYEGATTPAGTAPPPVPLPAAAWLLLSGLGALGFLRKRKAA